MVIVIGGKNVGESAAIVKDELDDMLSRVHEEVTLNKGTLPYARLDRKDYPNVILTFPSSKGKKPELSDDKVSIDGKKIFVEDAKEKILKLTVSPRRSSKQDEDDDELDISIDELTSLMEVNQISSKRRNRKDKVEDAQDLEVVDIVLPKAAKRVKKKDKSVQENTVKQELPENPKPSTFKEVTTTKRVTGSSSRATKKTPSSRRV